MGEKLLHSGVHPAADILPALHLVHQTPLTPELIPAMDQGDLGTGPGQKQGVLKGGVTAPHHSHRAIRVEGAVAHGAVGNALAHQFLLAGQAQGAVAHTGGQDQSPAFPHRAVGDDLEAGAAGPEVGHRLILHLDPQVLRLLKQVLCQLDAGHRGDTGIVLHQRGEVDLPPWGVPLQHQDAFARPGGIHGGRQAGGTCAHHNNICHIHTSF